MKVSFDFTALNSIFNIRPDPVLHFFGYLSAAMNESNPRAGPEEFQSRNRRRVFGADHRHILVVIWMRFLVVMQHLG
jgi:hypothetical protein